MSAVGVITEELSVCEDEPPSVTKYLFCHFIIVMQKKQEDKNKTKQNKTKQNKTKQNKTKQNKTKQNKTKQNKTDQIRSEDTW